MQSSSNDSVKWEQTTVSIYTLNSRVAIRPSIGWEVCFWSDVKLGGFGSHLEVSIVTSHSEELWYNVTVYLCMTTHTHTHAHTHTHTHIYIYIYIFVCVWLWFVIKYFAGFGLVRCICQYRYVIGVVGVGNCCCGVPSASFLRQFEAILFDFVNRCSKYVV